MNWFTQTPKSVVQTATNDFIRKRKGEERSGEGREKEEKKNKIIASGSCGT